MAMSIHNCTSDRNRYLFNNEEDNVVFLSLQVLYSDRYYMYSGSRNAVFHFLNIGIKFLSDKALNCTVVNQALPYLHGESLEITLTVPLRYNQSNLSSISD